MEITAREVDKLMIAQDLATRPDVERCQVLARLGLGDVAYQAPVLLTLSQA